MTEEERDLFRRTQNADPNHPPLTNLGVSNSILRRVATMSNSPTHPKQIPHLSSNKMRSSFDSLDKSTKGGLQQNPQDDDASFATAALWGLLETDYDSSEESKNGESVVETSSCQKNNHDQLGVEASPSVPLEKLQVGRKRLLKRRRELQINLEDLRKRFDCEDSQLMIELYQLEVEADVLQEDNMILVNKTSVLGAKLRELESLQLRQSGTFSGCPSSSSSDSDSTSMIKRMPRRWSAAGRIESYYQERLKPDLRNRSLSLQVIDQSS